MSRRRTNDPLGVSETPNLTTDPDREKELVAAYRQRLEYACQSYAMWQKTMGPPTRFNEALRQLKRSLNGPGLSDEGKRLRHPEIEIVISHHAKEYAAQRTGVPETVPTPEDRKAGARKASAMLKLRPGRPNDRVLTHHVEGLMALIQNYLGKPVMMQVKKDSVYDPQATNVAGEILWMMAKRMEPTVTETAVVNIVNKARRRYAGKQMRFSDFFPGYGARVVGYTESSNSVGASSQSR